MHLATGKPVLGGLATGEAGRELDRRSGKDSDKEALETGGCTTNGDDDMRLGKSAKTEFVRRIVPLGLGVTGVVGMSGGTSVLVGLLCMAAGIGVYAALPKPFVPSGAVQPVSVPPAPVWDLAGFGIGIPSCSLLLLSLSKVNGPGVAMLSLMLFSTAVSVCLFALSVRQETSWVRFFGNGFEFALFGRRSRVRYVDLADVRVKNWQAKGSLRQLLALAAFTARQKTALLAPVEETRAFVFTRKDGAEFTISSEGLPNLEWIMLCMDRAGVPLPKGIGIRQRKKTRYLRDRLYGPEDADASQTEQRQVARIAAQTDHSRRG
ncbi:hypothetical protein [Roseibium sp. RKSG952]|uniref:hypothetical protein n=1 Tax=Roseibium sp. RKSG952 TaxID=2529384 RepID=UPI0012BB764B|nr:hypothetical protein [Roseibium sp. RKSG952]MTH99289.1 hypothetical protein [Roseibium sp. RKSG952]